MRNGSQGDASLRITECVSRTTPLRVAGILYIIYLNQAILVVAQIVRHRQISMNESDGFWFTI